MQKVFRIHWSVIPVSLVVMLSAIGMFAWEVSFHEETGRHFTAWSSTYGYTYSGPSALIFPVALFALGLWIFSLWLFKRIEINGIGIAQFDHLGRRTLIEWQEITSFQFVGLELVTSGRGTPLYGRAPIYAKFEVASELATIALRSDRPKFDELMQAINDQLSERLKVDFRAELAKII